MRHDGQGRLAAQPAGLFVLRILLTGADGFTGRQFAGGAAAAGYQTVALACDLTNGAAVMAEVGHLDFDCVVHLAAISFVGHQNDRAFYDVNLFGTLNLLEALAVSGKALGRVLLASSANVYGNSEHSPVPETQAPAPVNHYAMSKLAMEHMARRYLPHLPVFVTRPFNYTGPGQAPQFVIPKLVDHFRRRVAAVSMGNLHVEREYNDVRFVCEAYLRLLECARPGEVYNVCSGQTYDFQTVILLLEKLTGHQLQVKVDPAMVRANEVHRLCGDPGRLAGAIGALPSYSLQQTLETMLAVEC
ncbi:MAG: GDP-mannose 4,6-dehydratase [Ramlibacter sp.]